jgi:PAS domain S-box-containing protein
MNHGQWTARARYGLAFVALALATGLRFLLDPYLGDGQPMVAFLIALAIVATLEGLGPALVVLAGSLAVYPFLFQQPRHQIGLPSDQGVRVLVSFVLIGLVVAMMCEALRRARRRAESGQEDLRREMQYRSRVESELRDRETRWRALIENNTDAITMMKRDGTILYISPAIERINGFTPEELIGKDGRYEAHPDDHEAVIQALSWAVEHPAQPMTFTARVRHKDGSWRLTENVISSHLNDPAIGALVVNTRDITERALMEDRVSEAEGRFRVFMDYSPAISYLKDEAGRYIWGNRAWVAQFSRPVEELLGLDDFALWPQDAARTYRESDRLALDTGQAVEVEEAHSDRHYFSVKFPLEHRGTRYVGGKTFDVTDRVRDRKALEQSEKLLLALADSMPQIVWAAQPDGISDYINHRWFEFSGFSKDQGFQQEDWWSILHPEDVARTREHWNTSVRSGEPFQIEYRFLDRRTGLYRWFLGRALPVRDEEGRIVRWYGTSTDIDDQKRAENAAEAASQAKDRFLAVLSHELRTPLTPILLSVSTLLDDASIDGEVRPVLEMIRRNVALESRLIDDLLDLTRIIRGTITLQTENCDAHSLISRALEVCRGEIEASKLKVIVDLKAPEHSVQADPARLQQVFWNLFKNAVKFSPPSSELTIRSWDNAETNHLVIEVEDRGIGIDPAFLPRMFDAFEQGEASSWTRKYGGLGLGLAISRSIIKAHKGTLHASSEGAGRGATFRVELPLVKTLLAAPSFEAERLMDRPSAVPLKILLIEDDPSTLSVMSRLLTLRGHYVTSAASVAGALAAALGAGDDFDLIISDLGLPDGNGVDLLRALHSRKAFPAIALTGFGMEEDVRRVREAGFVAHLTKPIDFRTLERTIQNVVSNLNGTRAH